ncbi:MAG TPA: hypothetical protein VHK27_13735 [Gammaproteobacteria bacterium]|nr:hypothetical protein [Gammaproteobacteria bacterium]
MPEGIYWKDLAAQIIADTLIEQGTDATPRSMAQALVDAGLGGNEFTVEIREERYKPTWVSISRFGVPVLKGFINTELSSGRSKE